MSRQYRSSEGANTAKQRSTRFDPSLDSALETAAKLAGVSVNALVSATMAEKLADPSWVTDASTLTASVQNYSTTLASVTSNYQTVNSTYAQAIEQLSGTPEKEDPHA